MIFRGRQPETSVWRRFRTDDDPFTFGRDGDIWVARVVTTAERTLTLLHELSEHLSPAVDMAISDARDGRGWAGESLALPDVREAIARLRLPLSTYGGVEVALVGSDDQLTLTPHLELWAYARTDRWLYLLEGRGLVEREVLDGKRWTRGPEDFHAEPELANAIALAAERLALRPTGG